MKGARSRDLTDAPLQAPVADAAAPIPAPLTAHRRVSSRWLVAVAGAGILLCTGGPSFYVAQHLTHPPGGWQSWMYVYPFAAVAVGGAFGLGRRLISLPTRTWPWPLFAVIAYVTWALLSALWSVSPTGTPPAAVTGIGIAAFGCWFGWCLRIDDQIWAVVVATATASITSALVIEFRPIFGKMYLDLGYPEADVPWQGIFGNRNSLAPVCVLGLIGLVGLIARRPSFRRLALSAPLALVHVVLLRKSGGLTSMVALVLVGATALAVPAMRVLKRLRVPGPAVAGGLIAALLSAWFLVFANLDRISSRLGGDTTFDSRRLIWADVRSFIRVRPLRGYGFWAFWDRADLTAESYSRLGAYGSAHNSALEVLLSLGLVGLVVYLIIVGAAVAGPFVWSWRQQSVAAWWWSLVVVFLVAENLTESFVLWHSYIWVLFLSAALAPFGTNASTEDAPEPAASLDVWSPYTAPTEVAPEAKLDDLWQTTSASTAGLQPAGDLEI